MLVKNQWISLFFVWLGMKSFIVLEHFCPPADSGVNVGWYCIGLIFWEAMYGCPVGTEVNWDQISYTITGLY